MIWKCVGAGLSHGKYLIFDKQQPKRCQTKELDLTAAFPEPTANIVMYYQTLDCDVFAVIAAVAILFVMHVRTNVNKKVWWTPFVAASHIIPLIRKRLSWASCQIREIAGAHAPGMPRTFSPPPRVRDPDMHHGTCVTHVPWCMQGSLTSGYLWNRRRGKTFPAFPAHAQPAILRIW